MTSLLALQWTELGSVACLGGLWLALGGLFFAVLRGTRRRSGLPRGL